MNKPLATGSWISAISLATSFFSAGCGSEPDLKGKIDFPEVRVAVDVECAQAALGRYPLKSIALTAEKSGQYSVGVYSSGDSSVREVLKRTLELESGEKSEELKIPVDYTYERLSMVISSPDGFQMKDVGDADF